MGFDGLCGMHGWLLYTLNPSIMGNEWDRIRGWKAGCREKKRVESGYSFRKKNKTNAWVARGGIG